jgi:hypothetical protein
MTKSEIGSKILPTDRRCRVRVSPQRRENLFDEFEKSKLSGQKFAKLTGLKYSTFAGVGEQALASTRCGGSRAAGSSQKLSGGVAVTVFFGSYFWSIWGLNLFR